MQWIIDLHVLNHPCLLEMNVSWPCCMSFRGPLGFGLLSCWECFSGYPSGMLTLVVCLCSAWFGFTKWVKSPLFPFWDYLERNPCLFFTSLVKCSTESIWSWIEFFSYCLFVWFYFLLLLFRDVLLLVWSFFLFLVMKVSYVLVIQCW